MKKKYEFDTVENSVKRHLFGEASNCPHIDGWKYSCEGWDIDLGGSVDEVLETLRKMIDLGEYPEIGGENIFDEFTTELCPAYIIES